MLTTKIHFSIYRGINDFDCVKRLKYLEIASYKGKKM